MGRPHPAQQLASPAANSGCPPQSATPSHHSAANAPPSSDPTSPRSSCAHSARHGSPPQHPSSRPSAATYPSGIPTATRSPRLSSTRPVSTPQRPPSARFSGCRPIPVSQLFFHFPLFGLALDWSAPSIFSRPFTIASCFFTKFLVLTSDWSVPQKLSYIFRPLPSCSHHCPALVSSCVFIQPFTHPRSLGHSRPQLRLVWSSPHFLLRHFWTLLSPMGVQ